eukprot:5867356-Amphidinium_carterae.1
MALKYIDEYFDRAGSKIMEASQDRQQLILYTDGAVDGEFSGYGAVLALPCGQVRIIKAER